MSNVASNKSAGIGDFGRLLGVGHTAVHKAIKTGRIPSSLVGTRLYRGRVVAFVTDTDAARAAFLENTDPTRRQDGAKISAGKKAANASARGDQVGAANHIARHNAASSDDSVASITESRAITEAYKAKITKLAYEREAGRLVDATEFCAEYAGMVAIARSRLLSIPSKAKARIPHMSVDDVMLIEELIREALEELANGR